MGEIISRKSTETRKGCHSIGELFWTDVTLSFVPIFVAGLAKTCTYPSAERMIMVNTSNIIYVTCTGAACALYITIVDRDQSPQDSLEAVQCSTLWRCFDVTLSAALSHPSTTAPPSLS